MIRTKSHSHGGDAAMPVGEKTRIGSQVGELKMRVVGYFSRFERFFGEGSRIHLQLSLK